MLAAEQSKEDTGRVVYSGPANAAVEFLKKEFVGDVLAEQATAIVYQHFGSIGRK